MRENAKVRGSRWDTKGGARGGNAQLCKQQQVGIERPAARFGVMEGNWRMPSRQRQSGAVIDYNRLHLGRKMGEAAD